MIKFHDKKLMIMRWNDCYKTKSKKVVSLMSTNISGSLWIPAKYIFPQSNPLSSLMF